MPIPLAIADEFESSRLSIRSPRSGDGEALNQAVIESFAELHTWMPWAKLKPSVAESELVCKLAREKFLAREDLQLLLFLKSSNTLIGSSGLHRIDWKIPKFEIGYWCRTSFVGRGYISEAVHRITRFAFEDLFAKRIEIKVDIKNLASARVPRRLGFKPEAIVEADDVESGTAPRKLQVFVIDSIQQLISPAQTPGE